MNTLSEAAALVLSTADPAEKCRLTRLFAADWRAGRIAEAGAAPLPDRPARPERPQLLPPNRMKKRSYGGAAGRAALLHALAHIELNAIDLAWDAAARFSAEAMPRAFHDDWVQVAVDEADHFESLAALLAGLGMAYGDLPAHDGLWQAAEKTADDLMARLAVVPMTLEVRGCDTTPATIEKLKRNGDDRTPPALEVIYRDEIRHVAAGVRWFRFLAERRGLDPQSAYHRLLSERFPGGLKPPFNHQARAEAGMERDWYEPMARP
jgi:uncharacterized ferritin-like protein (DUF455 family)